jgi:choline dehydrogenase-like flavoprotein
VEYTNDPRTTPEGDSAVHSIRASKMVVVSAGTFGSPGILERSGIGAKAILDKSGVEQVVDLPGVGENYQGMSDLTTSDAWSHLLTLKADHNTGSFPCVASKEAETLDHLIRGEMAHIGSMYNMLVLSSAWQNIWNRIRRAVEQGRSRVFGIQVRHRPTCADPLDMTIPVESTLASNYAPSRRN